MKQWGAIGVVLHLFAWPTEPLSAQNLIKNGGFGTANRFSTAYWVNANTPGPILNPLNGLGVAILDQDFPSMQQASQTVSTSPGVTYQLTFATRAPQWGTPEWRGYSSGTQPSGPWIVVVTIDGLPIGAFENDSMTTWHYSTNRFVAASARTKIGFYEGASGWPFLTDVRLVALPAPPTLVCPAPLLLECGNGTVATLRVGVEDSGGNPIAVVWTVDGTPYQTNNVPSGGDHTSADLAFTPSFDSGEHLVVVSASNGKTDAATCSTGVTVHDTIPPQITGLSVGPGVLWPPNHQMKPIKIDATATDACGPTSCKIVAVMSSDSAKAGRGHQREVDWQITGDLSANLRAERSGQQTRIYTIVVECADADGNKSMRSVTVLVPHQQTGHTRLPSRPGKGNQH